MDALGLKPPAAGCDVGANSEAEAPTVRPTLSQQISLLPQLNLSELRAEWRRLFRMQPPGLSRDLIVRGIAYRLQELAHGGLSKATVRKLARLGDELKAEGQISLNPGPQLKPGARLVREWHGRTYMVTATEEGFDYAGRTYRSLTKIARAITGAHWSGPRFFGLAKLSSGQRQPPSRWRGRAPALSVAETSVRAAEGRHGQN